MSPAEPRSVEDPVVELTAADVVEESQLQSEGVAAPAKTPAPPMTVDHWVILTLSCVVLFLAVLLENRGEGRTQVVYLPGMSSPLPETCYSKRMFGMECPGCGLTRSFIAMASGDVSRAWLFNPGGVLFFLMVVFQVPYRIYQIHRVRTGRRPYFNKYFIWSALGLALIMFGQWIFRLAGLY